MGEWAGWLSALPAVSAAVATLVLPGLAAAYAAGLRGIPAWGLAPALSVSVLSVGAVVTRPLGLSWGLGAAGVSALVALLVACAGGWFTRPPERPDPLRLRLAGLGTTLVGAGLGAAAVVIGVGAPDRVPQTYDAVFHLNAAARALATGNASSMELGTLTSPERSAAFYPGAWHAVTALVASASGADVAVAANAVSVAIAALWPLGCLLLVRQALGRSLPALLVGPIVSVGLGAAPFMLLSYGTVWPNALATLLLPATLAVGAGAAGLATEGGLRGRRAWAVGVAVAPGLALAHPNAAVTAAVYAVVLAAARQGATAGRGHGRGRAWAGWLACAGLAVGVAWALVASPVFNVTRGTDWVARQTLAQAAGEALLLAPQRLPVAGVLAGLGVLGLVLAVRRPELWWLAGCHAAAAALFVLAAGSDSALGQALTGPWYNDAFRLAAALPVTGVPLVTLGFAGAGAWAARVAESGWTRVGGSARWQTPAGPAWLAAVGCLLAVTQGVYLRDNARVVATWYGTGALIGAPERQLLERLDELVPARSRIAGNPWNGSALAEAVGGREVLFPHLSGAWGADRTVVAGSLARVASDATVCTAVRRLGVEYVLSGPSIFWPDDRRQHQYAGLEVRGWEGFEEVATGGRLTLYRITACGGGGAA